VFTDHGEEILSGKCHVGEADDGFGLGGWTLLVSLPGFHALVSAYSTSSQRVLG
jgi:hypothetical protein